LKSTATGMPAKAPTGAAKAAVSKVTLSSFMIVLHDGWIEAFLFEKGTQEVVRVLGLNFGNFFQLMLFAGPQHCNFKVGKSEFKQAVTQFALIVIFALLPGTGKDLNLPGVQ